MEGEPGRALPEERHLRFNGKGPHAVAPEELAQFPLFCEKREDVRGHPVGPDPQGLEAQAVVVTHPGHPDVVQAAVPDLLQSFRDPGHPSQGSPPAPRNRFHDIFRALGPRGLSPEDMVQGGGKIDVGKGPGAVLHHPGKMARLQIVQVLLREETPGNLPDAGLQSAPVQVLDGVLA